MMDFHSRFDRIEKIIDQLLELIETLDFKSQKEVEDFKTHIKELVYRISLFELWLKMNT